MEATKYNKSEIMKQAHTYYNMVGGSRKNRERNKTGRTLISFGECLRMACGMQSVRFPMHAARKP